MTKKNLVKSILITDERQKERDYFYVIKFKQLTEIESIHDVIQSTKAQSDGQWTIDELVNAIDDKFPTQSVAYFDNKNTIFV